MPDRAVCRARFASFVLCVHLVLGCNRSAGQRDDQTATERPPAPATITPPARSAPPALPPLEAPWLVRLTEDGGTEDVVTVPAGATEPRPVVVAIHGAGDRADWACGGWRIGVESYAFVVCPSGRRMGGSRYGWGDSRDIAIAIERALHAARARFGQYMAHGPMIYAAFSQGAILARPYLIANAQRFPLVALAEGGYDFVGESTFAQQLRDAGATRLLLLCGTPSCMTTMRRAARILERSQLQVFVTGDVAAGHNLNQPMQDALRRSFPTFTAGFAGWAGFDSQRTKDASL